jgi:hypothetical protein
MHKVHANVCAHTQAFMSTKEIQFLCTHIGAGLSSKLCKLKDKDVIQRTVLKEKQLKEIKVQK